MRILIVALLIVLASPVAVTEVQAGAPTAECCDGGEDELVAAAPVAGERRARQPVLPGARQQPLRPQPPSPPPVPPPER